MSEQPPEQDARGAAFAARLDTAQYVEWGGYRYEVRPSTLEFQDAMAASKASPTEKAISQIIHATYWPPDAGGVDSKGRARAGQPMFTEADRANIRKSYGDPRSLWVALLTKIGEMSRVGDAEAVVQEIKGNS